jgi:hypothetical protein
MLQLLSSSTQLQVGLVAGVRAHKQCTLWQFAMLTLLL